MGILALIQEILGLPAQLNALIARVSQLEAWIAEYQKQKESAAITKATEEAAEAGAKKDDEALTKALHDTINAVGHL